MNGYRVNSLDCSADGMERLRYNREAILIAYLCGTDETAESILSELVGDIDSAAMPEGASSHAAGEAVAQWAAGEAVAQWAADGGLAAIRAEVASAISSADEFDSVAFRLYLEWPESAEWPRLSVCADCLEAVANGLESGTLEPEALEAVKAGLERETASGARLETDCEPDCEGSFSWSPCELCQRPEGGARHRLAAVPK